MITARREQVVIRVVPCIGCGMRYSISTDSYYRANFKTIKKRHTGESRCLEKSRKYWILVFAGTTTTDF